MARIFGRDFLKIRACLLPHSDSIPALIQSTKPAALFSSLSSLDLAAAKIYPLYNKILDFLDSCKSSLTHLSQIQAQLVTSSLLQHPSFSGRMLKISSNLCDFDYTVLIFRGIEFPSIFCFNTVIKASACSSVPQMAMVLYIGMLKDGIFPNSFSFPPLLSACCKMDNLILGEQCHGHAVKNGVDTVLEVQNSLLHLYTSFGNEGATRQVLHEMPEKNVVSWNSIISGHAKAGQLDAAHKLFDAMPERNIISWNILMTGYLDSGRPGNVIKLFREIMKLGMKGNDITLVNVVTACGRSARLKEGKSVHVSLIRNFHNFSFIIDTSLIDMYGRCGRVDLARLVFDRMLVKNLVSWNAMILGYCLHGNPTHGLSLYAEMLTIHSRLEGRDTFSPKNMKVGDCNRIVPDEITFVGVLCACAREGLLAEGKNYFSQMIDVFAVKPNFAHYWCMANIFVKVGLRSEAIELLRNVQIDIVAAPEASRWAALFSSCRFEADVSLGEQLAKELIKKDPENFSYYTFLLNVYAVAGQWEDVAKTKAVMKESGIEKVPGCGLKDLKEIVHGMRVGNKWEQVAER